MTNLENCLKEIDDDWIQDEDIKISVPHLRHNCSQLDKYSDIEILNFWAEYSTIRYCASFLFTNNGCGLLEEDFLE